MSGLPFMVCASALQVLGQVPSRAFVSCRGILSVALEFPMMSSHERKLLFLLSSDFSASPSMLWVFAASQVKPGLPQPRPCGGRRAASAEVTLGLHVWAYGRVVRLRRPAFSPRWCLCNSGPFVEKTVLLPTAPQHGFCCNTSVLVCWGTPLSCPAVVTI